MIHRTLFLFTIFLVCFCPAARSQDRSDYDAAVKLAAEANQQLQAGEVIKADSLAKRSISLYPTLAIYDYALTRAELPDIAGCNLIMDRARVRVLTFKKARIWCDVPYKGLVEVDKNYAYFGFLLKAFEVNKAFGERVWMEYSLVESQKVFIPAPQYGFDYYAAMQQVLKVELLIMQRQHMQAAMFIQQAPPNSVFGSPEAKAQALIPILLDYEDYNSALLQTTMMNTPASRNAYHSWLFYINTLLGNTEKAMQHYRELPAEFVGANINANYYVLGLIAIKEKRYEDAIHNLQISVNKRGKRGTEVYMLVEKWKVYKALGDACVGLKLYNKARDHYKIALLAWPGYTPAVNAMADLEKAYAGEVDTDLSAPVITLSEPSPSRGFEVTSTASAAMVKGFASDPSGIKAITINGNEVYNRNDGNFWGEVQLQEGLNKITVSATDMAGNKAEQIFELNKKPGKAKADMVSKPGKNYALLLAAQNYTDKKIPSLENPVADAVKLKLILKNDYRFAEEEIITLFNPSADDMRSRMLELKSQLQPEDNLVIFYAGHGIWAEKERKGYWLLTDAKLSEPSSWLSNAEMLELIAGVPARHTLLITDACFSGSVFKTRNVNVDRPVAIEQLDEKISRVAITSGNDTEVPDRSVFMKYLVKALGENKEKYLSAQKMFVNHIIEAVMTETKTEPRYGTLEQAGHIGGDFIFMRR